MNSGAKFVFIGIILAVLSAGVFAYQTIDVNVIEYVDENNTWNGFCWNCGNSVSGDTNIYGVNQYGSVDAAWGDINFTNKSSTSNLADVVVTLTDVEETRGWGDANCSDAGNVNFWDANPLDGNIVIHILDMPANYSIDCNYTIDRTIASTPLAIYETYQYRTVVLQQPNPVTLYLVNQDPARFISLYNVTLTKTAPNGSNSVKDFNYTNCAVDSNGSISGCTNSDNFFTWNLGSYSLNDTNGTKTNPLRMSFTATEADYVDHNSSGFYDMGTITATFDSLGAVSSLDVNSVYAVGPADIKVYKRQDPDGESIDIYDGYDWGFNIHFKNNTTDINYNVNKSSLWITINNMGQDPAGYLTGHDYRDPNRALDINNLFSDSYMVMPTTSASASCLWNADNNHLECTTLPSKFIVGPGQIWYMSTGENIDSNTWWIDKNLGANPSRPDGNTPWIPIGWGKVDFTIDANEHIQYMKLFQNPYLFNERIYIIHDYIIEARKTFSRYGNDEFDINLYIHNRGTKNTPQQVFVYDVVPTGFDLNYDFGTGGFSRVPDGNQAIYGDINGTAFWWNVGPLDANGGANDSVSIQYRVIGSGDYNAIDLFIVGVDPIQSDTVGRTTPRAIINNLRNIIVNEEMKILPGIGVVLAAGILAGMFFVVRK